MVAYRRGMRRAARRRSWEPTVAPILASSPVACTAVVTISALLGRPSLERAGGGGGGGAEGRWAAVAFDCAAAVGAFFAARFLGADFGFAVAARERVLAASRRSAPRRSGRVVRRLPSTLDSAAAFEDFFDFFLADFCVMDTVNARGGPRPL